MSHDPHAPVLIDASAERCSRNVRALASMSPGQLHAFLEANARASATARVARAMRPKSKVIRRTPRHLLDARGGR